MTEGLDPRATIIQVFSDLTSITVALDISSLDDDAVVEYLASLLSDEDVDSDSLVDVISSMIEGFDIVNPRAQLMILANLRAAFKSSTATNKPNRNMNIPDLSASLSPDLQFLLGLTTGSTSTTLPLSTISWLLTKHANKVSSCAETILHLLADKEALDAVIEEKAKVDERASRRIGKGRGGSSFDISEGLKTGDDGVDAEQKKQIVARFADEIDTSVFGTSSSTSNKSKSKMKGKDKEAQAESKIRFRDGNVVSRTGQKVIVEDLSVEWDGGSRGRVKSKGKRGKGFT